MGTTCYPDPGSRRENVSLEKRSGFGAGCCLLGFGLLWSAITIPTSTAILREEGLRLASAFVLLFPVIGVTIVVIGLVLVGRNVLVRAKFGQGGVVASVLPGMPGETIKVAAAQLLKGDVPVPRASLELRCDEWVRWRRGTDTYTEERTIYKDIRSFDEPSDGGHVRMVGEFRIPDEAMHSFDAPDNKVLWFIRVHIEVPGWPDLSTDYEYQVAPVRAVGVHKEPPFTPQPVMHYPEKARVSILLDEGPYGDALCYELGTQLTGAVTVSVPEMLKCRGVYADLMWQTAGKGDTDKEVVWKEYLHRGPLMEGEHRFPFRFTLPQGPASYDGELLAVNWLLRAWVDIAWARDPGVEYPLWLEMPVATA